MDQQQSVYDLYQQGRAHMQNGDNAQATVPLEKAKRREPDKASIREALGVAYLRLRRYNEAAAEFEHILDAAPANVTRTTAWDGASIAWDSGGSPPATTRWPPGCGRTSTTTSAR